MKGQTLSRKTTVQTWLRHKSTKHAKKQDNMSHNQDNWNKFRNEKDFLWELRKKDVIGALIPIFNYFDIEHNKLASDKKQSAKDSP